MAKGPAMHGSGERAFQTRKSKGLKVGPSKMFSIRRRPVWLENKGQGAEGVKSGGGQVGIILVVEARKKV